MSKRSEAFISLYEDASWRGSTFQNPIPLLVDGESLSSGKEIKNNVNLTRDGRVNKPESQVDGPTKPSGMIALQPREPELIPLAFAHFQHGTRLGTGTSPYIYQLFPSKSPPTYSQANFKADGAYGDAAGDVYSVSFLKKYFDTDEHGGTNTMFFKHGICDQLTFDLTVHKDFEVGCQFKFRDLVEGTAIAAKPPAASVGTYGTSVPFQWFHGTVTVGGESLNLLSIVFTGNNNLTEKMHPGRENPESFDFGDYEVTGQFGLDFPKDGLKHIGSMFNLGSFAIVGTVFKGTDSLVAFDMPCCIRQPFDVNLNNETIRAAIPFRAFEKGGTAPITVTIKSDNNEGFSGLGQTIWDAWLGTRTIADFDIVDAGFGPRTASEYDVADRDFS